MSYLTTPELPSFSKAVISFWFKVSQNALDAVQKEYDDFYAQDDPGDPPPLLGLVPLVTFGKEGAGRTSAESDGSTETKTTSTVISSVVMNYTESFDGAVYTINWFPVEQPTYTQVREYATTTYSYSPKPGKPTNPSFIAIDGGGKLRVNFESTQIGDVTLADVIMLATSKYYTQDSADWCFTYYFLADCSAGGDSLINFGGLCGLLLIVFFRIGYRLAIAAGYVLVDQSSSPREDHPSKRTYGSPPGDAGTGAIGEGDFDIPVLAADTWHHVLVSVDMTGGSASTGVASGDFYGDGASHFTAASLMYIAVDDKNYLTRDNSPFPGTNKVVTGAAAVIAGSRQTTDYDDDGNAIPQGPIPSYSLTDMSVPAAPVGIPSVGNYTDHIHKVEMAEFLFFTDAVLDTGVEENRRHFITGPDTNGFQHPGNSAPIYISIRKFAFGDPATWEPGADNPAFAPPLFDPSQWPTGIKGLGNADIDFTKCQWNWQMGLNLGKLGGKVVRTGKIRGEVPPMDEVPKIQAGG
jgi:hypothetical protein